MRVNSTPCPSPHMKHRLAILKKNAPPINMWRHIRAIYDHMGILKSGHRNQTQGHTKHTRMVATVTCPDMDFIKESTSHWLHKPITSCLLCATDGLTPNWPRACSSAHSPLQSEPVRIGDNSSADPGLCDCAFCVSTHCLSRLIQTCRHVNAVTLWLGSAVVIPAELLV